MTILPASPNAGLKFRRVDLDGKPEIEANVENVNATNRSTSLAKGNAKIHTVEHILSAFAGMGIDNAIIELDANEPPIGDGSARPYVKLIRSAGIEPQNEPVSTFQIQTPISFENGDSTVTVVPHDRLKITCTSADKLGRFTQFHSLEITPETWEKEISDARTFCFYEEIEALYKNGLIKGGSLENAVIIRDDAILTNEPLRYTDEFVRHKILDIIGDMALTGVRLAGHIIVSKPGHASNCELARQIVRQMRKPIEAVQTFSPPPPSKTASDSEPQPSIADGQSLDCIQVMKILPHRYPFLMVDKVTKIEGNRIVGAKNITMNEPVFQGHFPGHPIFPGVLQLEAIAQVAGILMLKRAENFNKLAYFLTAENVKWRKPVRPGDEMVIDVELVKSRGKIGRAKGLCKVRDEVASEAEVTFMLIDK
jgi:UDP-3-O-[3-hydroxymyristoyl] N-acetylglucosamine deacetylase/3-hydroxyacyl-[acyl-carrier-protein] dehydratase